jgi:hypothetical protein
MTNREFFLHHCAAEFPRFLGVLAAVPADQLAYRPHPKSRSAYELIGHLIGHEQDLLELATIGSVNHRMQVPFASLPEGLLAYRLAHESLEGHVRAMSDAAWESPGRFLLDGKVIYQFPKRDRVDAALRRPPSPWSAQHLPATDGRQGAVDLRPVG